MSVNEMYTAMKSRKYFRRTVLIMLAVLAILAAWAISVWASGSISSLYLSPDPIKIGQSAYIRYVLDQDAYITIKIYNSGGTLVRTLLNNVYKTANAYSQYWDCKNSSGALVTDGSYRFEVAARDAAGNQLGFAETTVLAARVPGISSVSDAPDPVNPAVGQQSVISYSLSSDSLITVTILKGSIPVRTVVSGQAKPAGVNTTVWDGRDDAGNIVDDGPYYYNIEAVSPIVPSFKTTYKSSTSASTITIEKGAPQITDFTATPDPFKISASDMSIRYTLSEPARVTLKIVDESGAAVRTVLNGVSQNAGSNSAAWDGKKDDGSWVPEGHYSVVISAVDSADNSSGEQVRPFVAGYQPEVSNVVVNPDIFNPEDPATPQTAVSYSISHRARVTVEILNGYDLVKSIAAGEIKDAGTYSFTWDGRDSAGNIVGDADYTVRIKAVSPTVETFAGTYSGTVVVEKGAPGIYDFTLSPEPFKLGTGGNVSVRYSLSEDAGVYISVYKGDVPVRQLAGGVSQKAGYHTAYWDGKNDAGAYVSEGIYTVTICAVDRFGNADQARNNITCGYLPAISGVTDTPDLFFNPPVDVHAAVYFNLSADARVTLTVLKGTAPVRTIAAGILAKGVNYILWDGKDDGGLMVSDGPYTYKLEAVSPTVESFISTNSEATVTVEAAQPELSGVHLTPATVKIGSNATVRYTVSEPATVAIRVLDSAGTPVRTLGPVSRTAEGSYSTVWDTRDDGGAFIPVGSYKLKVTATDIAGQTVEAELPFEAGAVPQITDVTANPSTLNITTGDTNTTISYTVNPESLVTLKLLDANGVVWKTVFRDKPVTGADMVVVNVYENGAAPPTTTISYQLTAASVVGYFKSLPATGTLTVQGIPNPPMDCKSCHAGYPAVHPMANCAGCHGNDEPIQDCAKCHTQSTGHSDGSVLAKFKCEYCHNEIYSYKIPGHGDVTALHDTALAADCRECHEQNLTLEHPKYSDPVTLQPYDCSTCHQSTVAAVVYAVDNGIKDCAACHAQANHDQVHATNVLDQNCTTCHINNLTQEHLTNQTTQKDEAGNFSPQTCDTCHASTNQIVAGAVYTGNEQCAACHRTGHNMNFVETVPADIPMYPGFAWTPPQDAFLWAGESWMPDEYILGGKVIISNRRPAADAANGVIDTVYGPVYEFYHDRLTAAGWTAVPPGPAQPDYFMVTYTKGTRRATVWFYGGVDHTAAPVLEAGYRIEVIYK